MVGWPCGYTPTRRGQDNIRGTGGVELERRGYVLLDMITQGNTFAKMGQRMEFIDANDSSWDRMVAESLATRARFAVVGVHVKEVAICLGLAAAWSYRLIYDAQSATVILLPS